MADDPDSDARRAVPVVCGQLANAQGESRDRGDYTELPDRRGEHRREDSGFHREESSKGKKPTCRSLTSNLIILGIIAR